MSNGLDMFILLLLVFKENGDKSWESLQEVIL